MRGIYTGISAQCWAIGYLVGPILGGWALDQTAETARTFWRFLGLSGAISSSDPQGVGLLILWFLAKGEEGTTTPIKGSS